jgi:hypothetical protein
MVEPWTMTGSLAGPCNCDWGCPCNFDVAPTDGHCDGVYVYYVREGRYGGVSLDGLQYAFVSSSPGPVHEGDATSMLIIDEAATAEQRDVLEKLWTSGEAGLPMDIWNLVTKTWLETVLSPIELELDGIKTRARIGDGDLLEFAMSRVSNPVTGKEEEIYLDKPTGFTSTRSELGMSLVFRFACGGLSWDYSGQYAEYAEYSYAGPPGT